MESITKLDFIKQVYTEWSEDKASRLAAALAFYAVLSIPPLIVIILGLAGIVFEGAEERISSQLGAFLGPQVSASIEQVIENANRPSESTGLIATITGAIILLFGASGVFAQLQDAMNVIWDVMLKPNQGFLNVLRKRFFSFTMVLGVAFLLLISFVVSSILQQVVDGVTGQSESLAVVGIVANIVVSLLVFTVMFALMYKVIPDAIIQWHDVWVGAFATAVLFLLGQFAISFYLSQSDPTSNYGAAGWIIVLLLWVYYSTQILFFGAEFTQVYANAYGSRVEPDEDAIALDSMERQQQGIPTEETKDELANEQHGAGATTGRDGRRPAAATPHYQSPQVLRTRHVPTAPAVESFFERFTRILILAIGLPLGIVRWLQRQISPR